MQSLNWFSFYEGKGELFQQRILNNVDRWPGSNRAVLFGGLVANDNVNSLKNFQACNITSVLNLNVNETKVSETVSQIKMEYNGTCSPSTGFHSMKAKMSFFQQQYILNNVDRWPGSNRAVLFGGLVANDNVNSLKNLQVCNITSVLNVNVNETKVSETVSQIKMEYNGTCSPSTGFHSMKAKVSFFQQQRILNNVDRWPGSNRAVLFGGLVANDNVNNLKNLQVCNITSVSNVNVNETKVSEMVSQIKMEYNGTCSPSTVFHSMKAKVSYFNNNVFLIM